jgi:hypothetical protein
MLKRLPDMPCGVDGLEAAGTVTAADYEQVFAPLVDRARRTRSRLRLMYQFGPDFNRITAGGLLADSLLGTKYLPLIDGCAVVSDIDWIREPGRRLRPWLPCPIGIFGNSERGDAVRWLTSLPQGDVIGSATPQALAKAYIGGTAAATLGIATLAWRRLTR